MTDRYITPCQAKTTQIQVFQLRWIAAHLFTAWRSNQLNDKISELTTCLSCQFTHEWHFKFLELGTALSKFLDRYCIDRSDQRTEAMQYQLLEPSFWHFLTRKQLKKLVKNLRRAAERAQSHTFYHCIVVIKLSIKHGLKSELLPGKRHWTVEYFASIDDY